ncbi:MAG: M48 family metallopeptidase [Spirochaetes bacterium]|nr:M48 family metallopeptidase [Spirochaetota bacterium]
MRKIFALAAFTAVFAAVFFAACATDPMSGRRTMAFISNDELFPMAFAQHREIINASVVVTGTPEAQMLQDVGNRMVAATEMWLARQGHLNQLDGFEWEFTLLQDNSVNAWAMPGGKIVFYTGILPLTANEAGMAVVMGHEIAHAVLNHGQQRMSAAMLQQVGFASLALLTANRPEMTQSLILTSFGVGSAVLGTLPFSRRHEQEADHLGLILMAIAGYNPNEAALFWERMEALAGGGGTPQFLSTHPSSASRVSDIRANVPEALQTAASFGVHF